MADPPSYEESAFQGLQLVVDEKTDKSATRWNIREEVATSRTQHVASVVEQLLPQIRSRARQGLSISRLILIPSDQDASRKGQLVGFPGDDIPLLIQFEGAQNGMQFWSQTTAINELSHQLLDALTDGAPVEVSSDEVLVQPEAMPESKKSSWFGRKASKAPVIQPVKPPPKPAPVVVDVVLDDIFFRSESEFGLYETLRARAVSIVVEVR